MRRAAAGGTEECASKLPAPIFTPATKAEMGEHDENISFARMCEIVGEPLAKQVREAAIALSRAAPITLTRGIIIADTKFEFGLDENGTLTLMDEVLTPVHRATGRWRLRGGVCCGQNLPSYDKQFLRDWLENVRIDGKPWGKRRQRRRLPPR